MNRPLRIAIGVNGIGMGHAVRQSALAAYLRKRGHEIEIITTQGGAAAYFRDRGYLVRYTWMPTLIARGNRVRLADAVRANARNTPEAFMVYRRLVRDLTVSGIPDVFIADYEPTVSLLARRFERPLFSIDQQSKYRHLDLPNVDGLSPAADRQRLSWFVRNPVHSYVCSLMLLEPARAGIEIIPPLLLDDVRDVKPTDEPVVTAYFSRYFGHGPREAAHALVAIMASTYPDLELRLYAHPADAEQLRVDGLPAEVRAFDRGAFIADAARSRCVIANAGFNLMAEAMYLGKPMLVVPVPTYDQHWCAYMLAEHGLGLRATRITPDCVAKLITQSPAIAQRLVDHRGGFLGHDPRPQVAEHLERAADAWMR